MKKLVSVALISSLVLSSATFAFANPWKDKSDHGKFVPPGIIKKGNFPPGLSKKFMDIDGYEWAREAIERMAEKEVIKGISEALFAPHKEVSKLEAVVMALRVMGEEPTAELYLEQIKIGKKSFKLKGKIGDWAYGYVKLAEEKGILEEYELIDFNLSQPAKRHEVAKYMLRAAGYKEEAEDNMDETLDFLDAPAIPTGSVGYVYLAEDMGLITGYNDNTFRPNQSVTRAEMAVMIDRLDSKDLEDRDEYKIYKGEVTDIDTTGSSKSIEIDDDEVFKLISTTKVIFEDNVKGDIYDIKLDDEVKVKVNKYNQALSIEVDSYLYEELEGEVTDIDTTGRSKSIEIDNDQVFILTDDTKVIFEDEVKGNIYDIKLDDEVEIKVNKNEEVISIEVDRELDEELEEEKYAGTIVNIEKYKDEYYFRIYTSKKFVDFTVDDDFEVDFKDEEGTISDVRIGDDVKIVLDDEEVEEIIVDRDMDSELSHGTISDIYKDEEQILVKNNNTYTIISLDEDTKIYLNDDRVSFSKLKVDDNIIFQLDDDLVIKIKAYR